MLQQSFIISLIVLALHSFTWKGMVAEGVKKLIKEESILRKPLFDCPICMTPWWGTLIWVVFFADRFGWWLIPDWFLTVSVATGMSVVSVILINIREYCVKRVEEIERDEAEEAEEAKRAKVVEFKGKGR